MKIKTLARFLPVLQWTSTIGLMIWRRRECLVAPTVPWGNSTKRGVRSILLDTNYSEEYFRKAIRRCGTSAAEYDNCTCRMLLMQRPVVTEQYVDDMTTDTNNININTTTQHTRHKNYIPPCTIHWCRVAPTNGRPAVCSTIHREFWCGTINRIGLTTSHGGPKTTSNFSFPLLFLFSNLYLYLYLYLHPRYETIGLCSSSLPLISTRSENARPKHKWSTNWVQYVTDSTTTNNNTK